MPEDRKSSPFPVDMFRKYAGQAVQKQQRSKQCQQDCRSQICARKYFQYFFLLPSFITQASGNANK